MQHTLEQARLLSRRRFTRESVLAMLAGVTITITGCGDDDDDNPTGPTSSGDFTGVVSANHGHRATVTSVQITAANGVSLDIRGDADHTHTVALTAAQVVQIGNRQQVVATPTTDNAHLHTVTFNRGGGGPEGPQLRTRGPHRQLRTRPRRRGGP